MDGNAVRVARTGHEGPGATLGYLTREVAAKLAPMMDAEARVKVVARCADSPWSWFDDDDSDDDDSDDDDDDDDGGGVVVVGGGGGDDDRQQQQQRSRRMSMTMADEAPWRRVC
eukprot:1125988-Rhodomonas_salina.1